MTEVMHDIDTLRYEDGAIQFPVIVSSASLWISRKELEILFDANKAKIDAMLRRVFRTLPKESHMKKFLIPCIHVNAYGTPNQDIRAILHYDIETLIQLQSYYPNDKATQYIETAQSYLKKNRNT